MYYMKIVYWLLAIIIIIWSIFCIQFRQTTKEIVRITQEILKNTEETQKNTAYLQHQANTIMQMFSGKNINEMVLVGNE